MCDRSSTTLQRVLRSIKALSPADRVRVRNLLQEAPAAPSLRDAIQQRRGITPDTRHDRLTAALSSGLSKIGTAPSTPRAATVAFTGGK